MIQKPMDVLQHFPVRKSGKQKLSFRNEVSAYVRSLGYSCSEEKGSFGATNLVIGSPESAKFLITAHYDTCARLPFPNLITPCNFWCFLAYQLFMTAVMMLPSAAVGAAVGYLTSDFYTGYRAGYFVLIVMLALMLFGPANKQNANDNTSGVITVLEIAASLPEEYRDQVCFVLFDLEEAGLIGSASYQGKHKAQTKTQVVLNLDCVGDGDNILLFPNTKVKKDPAVMDSLRKLSGCYEAKKVALREKGFSVYPSDQKNFPLGVGIAAFHDSWAGLYVGRIHTNRDTVLDEKNVNILRDCLIGLITERAAQ